MADRNQSTILGTTRTAHCGGCGRSRDPADPAGPCPSCGNDGSGPAAGVADLVALLESDPRFRGRFRDLDLVGEGGMGAVYAALDVALDRRVALKFCHAHGAEFLERFRREGRILARLDHACILTLYDATVIGGIPVLVAELLEGATLADEIRRSGRLTPIRTREVLESILEGLSAAHQQGIVHRDLKSANVLVTVENRIKILDFGLASDPGADRLTVRGTIMGTPAYMAPEQARGEPASPRSDLYAAGIVAFECLTGRLPFSGTDPLRILRAQIHEDPPSLAAVVPGIPPAWEAFVRQALEKIPDRRFPGADAMREALHELETGTLARSGTQTTLAGVRRSAPLRRSLRVPVAPVPGRKRPPATLVGLTALGALVVGLAGLTGLGSRPDPPASQAGTDAAVGVIDRIEVIPITGSRAEVRIAPPPDRMTHWLLALEGKVEVPTRPVPAETPGVLRLEGLVPGGRYRLELRRGDRVLPGGSRDFVHPRPILAGFDAGQVAGAGDDYAWIAFSLTEPHRFRIRLLDAFGTEVARSGSPRDVAPGTRVVEIFGRLEPRTRYRFSVECLDPEVLPVGLSDGDMRVRTRDPSYRIEVERAFGGLGGLLGSNLGTAGRLVPLRPLHCPDRVIAALRGQLRDALGPVSSSALAELAGTVATKTGEVLELRKILDEWRLKKDPLNQFLVLRALANTHDRESFPVAIEVLEGMERAGAGSSPDPGQRRSPTSIATTLVKLDPDRTFDWALGVCAREIGSSRWIEEIALLALGRLGREDIQPGLLALARRSRHADTALRALDLLARLPRSDVRPGLRTLVAEFEASRSPLLGRTLVLLGLRGREEDRAVLERLSAGGSGDVAAGAAVGLGLLGAGPSIGLLGEGLARAPETLRRARVFALGRSGSREAWRFLEPLVSTGVRAGGQLALAVREVAGDRAPEALRILAGWQGRDPGTVQERAHARYARALLGDDAVFEELVAALRQESIYEQVVAIQGLVALGGRRALEPLRALAPSPRGPLHTLVTRARFLLDDEALPVSVGSPVLDLGRERTRFRSPPVLVPPFVPYVPTGVTLGLGDPAAALLVGLMSEDPDPDRGSLPGVEPQDSPRGTPRAGQELAPLTLTFVAGFQAPTLDEPARPLNERTGEGPVRVRVNQTHPFTGSGLLSLYIAEPPGPPGPPGR